EISPVALKSIFLLTQSSESGIHVEPVLQKGGPTHAAFLNEVLHETDETLQNSYRALVFTGKASMPKAFRSDAEVIAYVARTRGAIGYVSDGMDTQDVKTLIIVDSHERSERKLITRVEPVYPETLLRMQIGGTVRL